MTLNLPKPVAAYFTADMGDAEGLSSRLYRRSNREG